MVSVLILTLNEATNIASCIESLRWCDDIVVLDSLSSDQTTTIAREHGARVVSRPFDDYASQRNFGLQQVSYRHPWLLMLDADERVPTELRDELLRVTAAPDDTVTLYRLRRRDHLYGRWIRRSGGYPTWFGRLMRIGRVWVERPINEEYCTDGRVELLQNHLDHFPFNKGFHEWIQKHDSYSTREAILKAGQPASSWTARQLLAKDPVIRRAAQKDFLYRMPMRPALMFLALYIFRGGFVEGRAGLTFCLLRSWYEFMIDCKVEELKRRSQNRPV